MKKLKKAFKSVARQVPVMLAVTFCLSACSTKSDNNVELLIHYDLAKADMNAASEFFSNRVSFIAQSTAQSIVGQISRAIEVDSLLIVSDNRNQVLAFEINSGANVFAIHNVGQGPGEYLNLWDIAYNPERKELLLLADKKILVYNTSGVYTGREISLDEYCNELVVKDGMIYLEKETYANNTLADTQIEVVDYETGKVIATYLQPLEEYAPYCTTHGRSLSVVGNADGTDVLFTRKFDSKIYSLREKGLEAIYAIDWGNTAFVPEKTAYDCLELTKLCLAKQLVYQMVDIQKGDSAICFTTNFPELFIADIATLELKRYPGLIDEVLRVPLREMIPITGSKGRVLFSLPYHMLAKYDNMMPHDDARHQLVESMNDDSNPLYVIYTLK